MLKDLIGRNNGYLKIISYDGIRNLGKRTRRFWKALCKCGNEIFIHTHQFTRKVPRSCGCYKRRRRGNTTVHIRKHGLSHKHPLYKTWRNMRQRCYNPNNQDYKYYGGKGIKLCGDWHNDFKLFYDWALSHGWKSGLVIDRVDPDKDYCPDNCRYISMAENSKRVKIPIGENRKQAILNEKQVREIKRRIVAGERNYLIARDYEIKPNIVYQIKKKKTWKHVL